MAPADEVHGIESVELHSVGIDIGTTTSHLTISRLLARREGGDYSSTFRISETDRVYESEIFLTPYSDEDTIDTDALDSLVQRMYDESAFDPSNIDTGAVNRSSIRRERFTADWTGVRDVLTR